MTGAEVTYDVTVVATEGDLPVVGSGGGVVTEITVPANGTTTFSVLLSPTADGSMYGKVVLAKTGSPELHLPYYAEVTTDDPVADVYLVDGDSSGYYPTCTTDYTPIYEAALTAASLTFTTTELDPDTGAGFDFLQARRHDWVLYIDGEPGCGGNLSYFFGNDVRNFLAEGGRMVVMGQDAAYNDLFYYTYYGRTFNPALFFGAKIVSDNLLDGAVMQTAGDPDYSPWVGGTVIGLDAVTTVSADEISPLFYTDVDAYPVFANKLAPAAVGDPYKGGMGTRMSSEPTIERVQELTDWTHMPYRTLLTSFGLENVTTPLDRETLVRAFNIWLTNETTVA
jgi:hypothetical protein